MSEDHHGTSMLVSNMRAEAAERELFPVLIGDHVCHFHDVEGHYDKRINKHVVKFIHEVQGHGSPNRCGHASSVEAHLDNFYYMEVDNSTTIDEYPSEDYVIELSVFNYMHGAHSFSEALTADIDTRETQFEL